MLLSVKTARNGKIASLRTLPETGGRRLRAARGRVAWFARERPLRGGRLMARRGVGRALVEDALERMERPVSIEVLEGNGPALALYLGCGFREAGTASGQMPGNEAFSVTCHVLRLD